MTPLRQAIMAALDDSEWQTAKVVTAKVEGWSLSTIRTELGMMAREGLIRQEIDQRSVMVVRARYRKLELAHAAQ